MMHYDKVHADLLGYTVSTSTAGAGAEVSKKKALEKLIENRQQQLEAIDINVLNKNIN